MPLTTCWIPLAIYHLQSITLRLTDLPLATYQPTTFLFATCDFSTYGMDHPPLPPTLYTWPRRSRTYPVLRPSRLQSWRKSFGSLWTLFLMMTLENVFELNQVSKHKHALQCLWYLVCEMERDFTWSYQCWVHKLFIRLFLRVLHLNG